MKNNNHNMIAPLLALFTLGVGLLNPSSGLAVEFGPAQIPTMLTVSAPQSVYLGKSIEITARLTRLDTGAPLRSEQINFWFGEPTYPSTRAGTRVATDNNGIARITYTPSTWGGKGTKVVLAEYLGRGSYAQPLPYSSLIVK